MYIYNCNRTMCRSSTSPHLTQSYDWLKHIQLKNLASHSDKDVMNSNDLEKASYGSQTCRSAAHTTRRLIR